jgi:hypothetical protein
MSKNNLEATLRPPNPVTAQEETQTATMTRWIIDTRNVWQGKNIQDVVLED